MTSAQGPGGYILETRSLSKSFGAFMANRDINLQVRPLEARAVIGPNGAGKTTLINQLAGNLAPNVGDVLFKGRSIVGHQAHEIARRGIGRTFQRTNVFDDFTVFENVRLAVQRRRRDRLGLWRPARSMHDINERSEVVLETVGLLPRSRDVVAQLSHGEKRQLELGMALGTDPELLLLDEPMAGMSVEEGHRITELLLRLKQELTIVLIEHDMDAVFAVADRITVLNYGEEIATGEADQIRTNRAVQEAYLGTH